MPECTTGTWKIIMTETNVLAPLLTATADLYRTHDSDIARSLAAELVGLTGGPIVELPSPVPLPAALDAALAQDRAPIAS